jgi:hypothetical protein
MSTRPMWLLTVSMAHLASRRSGKHFLRNAQRQSDTSRYPFDGTFWRAIYRLPFRVNRAVLPVFRLLPVLTHKRTFSGSACMSQTCHNRTHAPQQIGMLSSSVGAIQRVRAGGKSLPARTIRRLHYSARGIPLSIRFVVWPFSPMRRRLIN